MSQEIVKNLYKQQQQQQQSIKWDDYIFRYPNLKAEHVSLNSPITEVLTA